MSQNVSGLTGFEVLRRSTTLGVPTPEPTVPSAAGQMPDRLREVDLKLAPERAQVVDSLEIAAYLEADGFNDEGLRDRYDAGGLFHAAELLYAQRGTGRALSRVVSQPAPAFPWHLLQRGPLYLLPGVVGLLITGVLGSGAALGFAFAAAFGWGYSMLIAAIRYAEPFGVPGRALRAALVVGVVASALGGGLTALLLAGPAQAAYGLLVGTVLGLACGASGILLALNRSTLFGGAMALPLLLAGMVYVLPSQPLALIGLGALALFPLLAVLNATRSPGELPVRWATFQRGLPLAAYGWALAAAFVAMTAKLGGWALLPVIVSAGVLEAGVWHAQERLQHASRAARDLNQLARRGLSVVPGVALGYGLLLLLGTFLLLQWPLLAGAIPAEALIAVPVLGTAFLFSAWLANQRREWPLLGVWLLVALLLWAGLLPLWLTCTLLLALLLPLLYTTLHDPRSYR